MRAESSGRTLGSAKPSAAPVANAPSPARASRKISGGAGACWRCACVEGRLTWRGKGREGGAGRRGTKNNTMTREGSGALLRTNLVLFGPKSASAPERGKREGGSEGRVARG